MRRFGPAGVAGQEGPPGAAGSEIDAEKNGTPPGLAIEKLSAAPRSPSRAVRTNPSAGTLANETRPWVSVTPWKNWLRSADVPTHTVAPEAGRPPLVTVTLRPPRPTGAGWAGAAAGARTRTTAARKRDGEECGRMRRLLPRKRRQAAKRITAARPRAAGE